MINKYNIRQKKGFEMINDQKMTMTGNIYMW